MKLIIWPLPRQVIEAHTATTVVITGRLRVLVYWLRVASDKMKNVRCFPFVVDTAKGRTFEPGQAMRVGVVNSNPYEVVLVGGFDCYVLEASATEADIERLWKTVSRPKGARSG